MNYGRLPVDEQVAAFQEVLLRNPTLAGVLRWQRNSAPALDVRAA